MRLQSNPMVLELECIGHCDSSVSSSPFVERMDVTSSETEYGNAGLGWGRANAEMSGLGILCSSSAAKTCRRRVVLHGLGNPDAIFQPKLFTSCALITRSSLAQLDDNPLGRRPLLLVDLGCLQTRLRGQHVITRSDMTDVACRTDFLSRFFLR